MFMYQTDFFVPKLSIKNPNATVEVTNFTINLPTNTVKKLEILILTIILLLLLKVLFIVNSWEF